MGAGFKVDEYQLKPVHLVDIAGMIFINLSDENTESAEEVATLLKPYLEPYDIAHTKVAYELDIVEKGNWKLVLENNRECFHCADNHPELLVPLHPYGFGAGMPQDGNEQSAADKEFAALMAGKSREWDDMGLPYELIEFPQDLWCRTVRLPLANGCVSQTVDGKVACKKLLGQFEKPESSSLSVWTHPNSWHHFMCDHIVTFTVLPLNEGETLVKTRWLLHEDAEEGKDYDLDHMTHVWKHTNDQDRALVEMGQMGVNSSGYEPGPYSADSEGLVLQFVEWYGRNLFSGDFGDKLESESVWNGENADLVCTHIIHETHDVKTFWFKSEDDSLFKYKPGQNVLFQFEIDGEEYYRNYTLSSSPSETREHISITIKRKPGGPVSNWLHDTFDIGNTIKAFGPNGKFTYVGRKDKKLLLLSGGSGITPVSFDVKTCFG